MKNPTNYQRVASYLVKIFRAVNEEYFDNSLEEPVISIQSSATTFGHISTSKIWSTGDKVAYELNLSADYLSRPIENVVATMIHEATHLYCMMNGIKDTSNGGYFHNKRFKKVAEERGHLMIERHEKYGWTITSPSEVTIDFCIAHGFEDIKISRNTPFTFVPVGTGKAGSGDSEKPVRVKKPSSTRKYQCPVCHNSFRATKNLNVLCMDCNEQFVVVD